MQDNYAEDFQKIFEQYFRSRKYLSVSIENMFEPIFIVMSDFYSVAKL